MDRTPRDRRRDDHLAAAVKEPDQRQSPHDDISGLNPGLYVRTGHGDHVVAGRAEGVGDFGGEVVLHPVQDAIDRNCETIDPCEGDVRDGFTNPVAKTGNTAVLKKDD